MLGHPLATLRIQMLILTITRLLNKNQLVLAGKDTWVHFRALLATAWFPFAV